MQQNFFYPSPTYYPMPQQNPNAVNINIVSPQAYGSAPNGITSPVNSNGYYSLYNQNTMPNLPLYPQNYNNLMNNQYNTPVNYNIGQPQSANQQQSTQDLSGLARNAVDDASMNKNLQTVTEVNNTTTKETTATDKKEKTKKVTPLTDEYVKSLENYMNNNNPKVRLIGAKELMERFKEDENRKDNPSLMPLLNKALRDTSPAVRFLGLTTLQLGYAVGNDETVTILKEIQAQNQDKIGEDSLLASEILLNMSGGQKVEVPMTPDEIAKAEAKASTKKGEA